MRQPATVLTRQRAPSRTATRSGHGGRKFLVGGAPALISTRGAFTRTSREIIARSDATAKSRIGNCSSSREPNSSLARLHLRATCPSQKTHDSKHMDPPLLHIYDAADRGTRTSAWIRRNSWRSNVYPLPIEDGLAGLCARWTSRGREEDLQHC